MDLTSLLIQAIGGAVGGNVGGMAMKNSSLGTVGNSVAGGIGGIVLGQLVPILMNAASQPGGLSIQNIIASGAGGIILQIIVGMIKSKMA